MISFISSSRVWARYAAMILATLCFLGAFEYAVRRYERIDWYRIEREVEAQRPDIILIGNSMLDTHVSEKGLEAELSAKAGRPIKAYFIQKPGCDMPTFYLILKYQLAMSSLSGIPVGVVDFSESNFLSIGADGTERGQIKSLMPVNDQVFLDRYYDPSLALRARFREYCQSCYFSPEFSRGAVAAAALEILSRLGVPGNPAASVKSRFDRLGGLENKLAVERVYIPRRDLSFDQIMARSFIPETLRAMSRFSLFFVVTHHAPYDPPQRSSNDASLAAFLASSSVPLIDMRADESLDEADFYSDHIHATKAGREVITKALADDIYKLGLMH